MVTAAAQPPKRKRGRPPGQRADAPPSQPQADDAENDNARPKKRSRRLEAGDAGSQSKRRGTRDRTSGDNSNWWQTGDDSQPDQDSSPTTTTAARNKVAKSVNTSKTKKVTSKKLVRSPLDANGTGSRGRGRPRTSGVSSVTEAEATGMPSTAKSARKRPDKQQASKASTQLESPPENAESPSQQRKKKGQRWRSHNEEAENKREAGAIQAGEEEHNEEENEEDEESMAADTSYQQLIPRTRLIPLATMTSKWAPLEPDAIAAVQALLNDCARPVLSRLQYGSGSTGTGVERRHEQARQAIGGATRRLQSKLVRGIPFPPAAGVSSKPGAPRGGSAGARSTKAARLAADAHAADFNYERTIEAVKALEQQLDPLQHAIALLTRERAREEQALEDDYATLHQLETNAQAESRTWRQDARRAHVLAPVDTGGQRAGSMGHVELVKQPTREKEENSEIDGGVFETTDKDLQTLSAQLGNHMDSLRGNLQQIEGVMPAIVQSRAALQHVLQQRLDADQYDRVILGY